MADELENGVKDFGQNLRKIRKSKKLTTETLANLAELEIVQINRIELGKTNPKLKSILAIAKALEISPKDLFDY